MHNINWEKFGVYFAVIVAFITIVAYIADIKERTRALEIKIEKLEPKVEKIEEKIWPK